MFDVLENAGRAHRLPLLAFTLSLFFCSCPTTSPAQSNSIHNPGFEQPAKPDGLPAGGWWLYEGTGDTKAVQDAKQAHTGGSSVRMYATTRAKSVLVSNPFPVVPGDELKFEAWVRAENLSADQRQAFAGLAFRRPDGGVFKREYAATDALGTGWSRIAGTAVAPEGAASAEIHLGYTNTPATLWFDDVSAGITSPVSFSLSQAAKPWSGQQDIAVLVVNRQTTPFRGNLRANVGRQQQSLPVSVEPGASRQITLPINLTTTGAHNYTLTLIDSAGTNVRSLKGKFHTSPALVLYPACPCYHAVGQGNGDTRIDARINLNPADRAGLRFAATVFNSAGDQLETKTVDASRGDTAGMNFFLPIAVPGHYEIRATLRSSSSGIVGEATTDVHVAPLADCVVTTGADGFLRVGGQTTFPVGLYSAARYPELARAGFTAGHNYAITTGAADEPINPNESEVKRLLDQAVANHMRMMIELPRKPIEKAKWDSVRRRILTFRYHPGLLCWGSEERVARGEAPLSHIAQLYRLVHELDPNHPFVLGDTKDVIQKFQKDRSDFFPDPCMDAGIWWWYPIPLKEPDASGLDGRERLSGLLQPPSWLTSTISKKPLWIAIQAYQHPSRDARFPTPDEYRCMAFLSIINGVKSIWLYTGSGQRDFYGNPAGLLNKTDEAHWDYVQRLVRELREDTPIITAPAPTARLTLAPADAPVEFALRERDGKFYLFAASKSPQPQIVTFRGACLSGRAVKLLHEDHSATLSGNALTDRFVPFGTHLYELAKP